jgi:glycosyltransferase involved in cell wall biosynthesis
MKKTRILFAGDTLGGSIPTGLGNVAVNFLKRFPKDKFELAYANIAGGDIKGSEDFKKFGKDFVDNYKDFKCYNCQLLHPNNYLLFDKAVKEFGPDIVISIHDPWMLDQIVFSKYRNLFFWASYVTIETPDYDEYVCHPTYVNNVFRKSIKESLKSADLVIPVTSIGADLFERWELNNYCANIYNGIDISNEVKEKPSKSKVFGNTKDDDFIFFSMGVNSKRKRLDLSIEAFAKFLKKIPEDKRNKYKLYIHTNVNSTGGGGTDLGTMVVRLGLSGHVMFSKELTENKFLDKKELYRKIRACDCCIGLSCGEGFWYAGAESMFNKIPVIYGDYGGHTSYLEGIGVPVKLKTLINAEHSYIKWGLMDVEDAAQKMLYVVNSKEELKENVEKGYKFAKEEFDWEVVSKKLQTNILNSYELYKKNRDAIFNFDLRKVI